MAANMQPAGPAGPYEDTATDTEAVVISAILTDGRSARAAITELRQMGISAADISLISRNEQNDGVYGMPDSAGVSGTPDDDGFTHNSSPAPLNAEGLPTGAQNSVDQTPVFLDFEVPPDEPLGGSLQLGLHKKASGDAGMSAYTDHPSGIDGHSRGSTPADSAAAAELGEERVGGAVVGAGLGGVAGLLVGVGALLVPGIGPLVAAGPLAVALGGMLSGGMTGALIGALATAGVPEEYARGYAASIEQGRTLVSVRTNAIGRDAIERVLVAHGGTEVR